tara:strand:- start:3383 stop:3754 length:372 start_codon:yes stop_codon:yes gene_type:complete
MTKDLGEIETFLRQLLIDQQPALRIRKNETEVLEACGTKEAMQGKQKVDGFYFASIMPKPKDVRFYFFPLYTHVDAFTLSPDLQKMLKGKTCFHIKQLNDDLKVEIRAMIESGVKIFQEQGLT